MGEDPSAVRRGRSSRSVIFEMPSIVASVSRSVVQGGYRYIRIHSFGEVLELIPMGNLCPT